MKSIGLLLLGSLVATSAGAQNAPPDSLRLSAGQRVRLVSHVLEPGWHEGTVAGVAADAGDCKGVEVAFAQSHTGHVILMLDAIDTIEVAVMQPSKPVAGQSGQPSQLDKWKRVDAAAVAAKYACKP
ncbi:MAG TPA: hypothetical protein VGQ30_12570 [Gemmatimonadaceae bacterium]|jgi:hypothetical protein|nr:hypothetical protein [Gemmatimonadaceae bacterium]